MLIFFIAQKLFRVRDTRRRRRRLSRRYVDLKVDVRCR